jgi:hypothetical protein
MKRIISSVLAAVMMLTLLAGIVCLPVSAFNAADWGECTLWSDKTVYEVGDPIWVKGFVEVDPNKNAWIGLIVRDHSEWGGLRYEYPRNIINDQPVDLAAGERGGNHNLAPYQSLPVGEYTIVLVPNDLPLAGDPARKVHILKSIDIEIVEKHHNQKLDVPSGTALMLARSVQAVRDDATLLVGRHENGKRTREEIGIHSLRMGNTVGIHEVIVNTGTQIITLKHEAQDRALFAEGALAAAAFIAGRGPGLYSMQDITKQE